MISIIIPIYNTPFNRFEKCISSILENDCSNLEIIIVDDGSNDIYSDYYRTYCRNIKYIKYFKITNSGPSAARNYGVIQSEGEYITFVDADDYIAPFFLEDAKKIIDQLKCPDIIIGLVKYAKNDLLHFENNNLQFLPIVNYEEKESLINHILGKLDDRFCFGELGHISDGPVARLIKKSIIQDNNFEEKLLWNEDTIWNIKILAKCNRIFILNRTWYAYYNYLDSSTNKFRENCLNEFFFILSIEFATMKAIWPNNYSGIYYMMYKDFRILNRTYIFHVDHHINICRRFAIFGKAVDNSFMQNSLKYIIKEHKINSVKEVMKHIIYLDMIYGTKILAFFLLKARYNFVNI